MRLPFDQNLSRRLVGMLRDAFPDSVHVVDVELDPATDREIWKYAGEHDLVVVLKDSDFRQLAFLHGPPPKVVWLRVGNASTAQMATVLLGDVERIEVFVDDDEGSDAHHPSTYRAVVPGVSRNARRNQRPEPSPIAGEWASWNSRTVPEPRSQRNPSERAAGRLGIPPRCTGR